MLKNQGCHRVISLVGVRLQRVSWTHGTIQLHTGTQVVPGSINYSHYSQGNPLISGHSSLLYILHCGICKWVDEDFFKGLKKIDQITALRNWESPMGKLNKITHSYTHGHSSRATEATKENKSPP